MTIRFNTCYNTMNNVTSYDNVVDGVHNVTSYEYTSDSLPSKTTNDGVTATYTYDHLGRLNCIKYKGATTTYTSSNPYVYVNLNDTDTDSSLEKHTTTHIAKERVGNQYYKYDYDKNGNISSIYKGTSLNGTYRLNKMYIYGSHDELTGILNWDTDGETLSSSYLYTYDTRGNITNFRYVLLNPDGSASLDTDIAVFTYNSVWKDLIATYNGTTITYDNAGNPTQYRDGIQMAWTNGNELATLTKGSTSVSYKYDDSSIRTKKTVNGTVHNYEYVDGKLMYEEIGNSDQLYFRYDAFGNPLSISRGGIYYYYGLNRRGDVMAIYNTSGSLVCRYEYDEWGKFLDAYNSSGTKITSTSHIALVNPLRYRGYYYDTESGFYYLGSRYYDPQIFRFLNADSVLSLGGDVVGLNLFAYCSDNPVVYKDPRGNFRPYRVMMSDAGGTGSIIKNNSSNSSSGLFGAGATVVQQSLIEEKELNPECYHCTL